jgi:hypothetical protein
MDGPFLSKSKLITRAKIALNFKAQTDEGLMAFLHELVSIFLGCAERSVRFRTYIFLGIPGMLV